ncbi:MAG: dihydrodiol dehydrogenase [Solirubrobacterales bacterium]
MAERGTPEEKIEREEATRIANEFATVEVSRVRTRNGERLEILSPRAGALIRLDPLELEALSMMDPDFFSRILEDPASGGTTSDQSEE